MQISVQILKMSAFMYIYRMWQVSLAVKMMAHMPWILINESLCFQLSAQQRHHKHRLAVNGHRSETGLGKGISSSDNKHATWYWALWTSPPKADLLCQVSLLTSANGSVPDTLKWWEEMQQSTTTASASSRVVHFCSHTAVYWLYKGALFSW